MTEESASVWLIASIMVLKTGNSLPANSIFWPPFPGVTPPTKLVPYSTIFSPWNLPCEPVIPWISNFESS